MASQRRERGGETEEGGSQGSQTSQPAQQRSYDDEEAEGAQAVLGARSMSTTSMDGLACRSRTSPRNIPGAVWTRLGLLNKTRSMLNLAMLAALNRPEFKICTSMARSTTACQEEVEPGLRSIAASRLTRCVQETARDINSRNAVSEPWRRFDRHWWAEPKGWKRAIASVEEPMRATTPRSWR